MNSLASASAAGFAPRLLNKIYSRLTFRPLVYGYANARVHGMFSNFIPAKKIDEMISCRTVQSLAEVLERTAYKQDLIELSLRFKGEELIELAVGQNFAKFAKTLIKLTPEQDKTSIKAILSRWDAHNIKTIILARKQKKNYSQIAPYLVLAGSVGEDKLKHMLQAQNSEQFYEALRSTEFGRGLLRMPSSATESENSVRQMFLSVGQDYAALEPILAILDIYSYSLMAGVAKAANGGGQVSSLLARQAYEKNLSTVLRLLFAGTEPQKLRPHMVPGGRLSARQWVDVSALKDTKKILQRVSRHLPVEDAIAHYEKSQKISSVEVAISLQSAKRSLRQFRHTQMSLATIVGALLLKEQEVANIRKIARGKALGLDAGEIEKMMVLVK